MPADPLLRCEVTESVGTITIDNPAKRNAMTAAMWRALPGLLSRLDADPAVRVIVLTGAGDHFCAGADIGELSDITDHDIAPAAEEALAAVRKPAVAAIRGVCVGGGCQLAAACDLRLAAADARFAITPAKIGIIYPAPTTARLVGLVGPAAAKYLLYSADLVEAAHALRIGLVDEVTPADRLAARVAEFTAALAARSQLSLQATKDIVDSITAGSLTDDQAQRWYHEVRSSDDVTEGVAAFLERRPPRFTWTGATSSPGDRRR